MNCSEGRRLFTSLEAKECNTEELEEKSEGKGMIGLSKPIFLLLARQDFLFGPIIIGIRIPRK